MLSIQLKSGVGQGPGFFLACSVLLNILSSAAAETDPSQIPSISNSVATHVCKQQGAFQESGEIQTPVKGKPEDDDAACGWYAWSKCEDPKSESESGPCPSFVLGACDQPQKTGRKGKGINLQQNKPIDKCENSTEQGLPKPEIVAAMSKYPSVVTIERGDRCQAKFCTGLILNENWILVQQTGCLYQYLPEHPDYYSIVAGRRRMHVEEGTEQRRSVGEFIPHPGLLVSERHYYKDNIAVVRLAEPLELNENVQPIDLAAVETIAPSIEKAILTIVGYLKAQPMKEDEEILASLIESPLDFVPVDECYDDLMKNDSASKENLICAGKCVVQGDEAKQPLRNILYAQESAESAPVPVGIGPVRHKDGNPQHGVFMNIASYIPWIKETMEGGGGGGGETGGGGQTAEDPEADSDSRIILGEDVTPNQYPSMVNMEGVRSYACRFHTCGGMILSEEWFLTAAHCADGWPKGPLGAIVGDHNVLVTDEGEQTVTVTKAVVHEGWDWATGLYDIAVLKVSPPFQLNDKVQKVVLPEPSFVEAGPFMAVGWGLTEKIIRAHILKQVEIPLVPLDVCQKLYENLPRKPNTTQICAGNETHGICSGDSGGPIYQIGESGEQILVGFASFGGTVCKKNRKESYDPDPKFAQPEEERRSFSPNVFTKVASYIDWIMKNAEMGG